ncbi:MULTISPECIES: PLP-dependent aminotransferase family protein [Vibrio]|uniref:aminotransferase-like domain-containing protein n=1 Tax=Vibrio TaxID=662 RepID=UPI000C171C17|nr:MULTISPECIES: PLP-dependent aminotransferase family protein [Vibrio]NNN44532.1 PLP-dependent aminotransferase family protein [Vibrio sp. 1-1(7)]NNN73048.1 PLP-dependent aminotransferase family protein [Vibrio sp. 12-2(3-a)]
MDIAKSLQQVKSSYIREILAAASDKNVISLAGGLPDEATFPIELMRATLVDLAEKPHVFQYGATAGYGPLIDFLKQHFALPAHHEVMITTGSQQGLDLIARAYINPGDHVVMEAPSYLGAMQVFGLAQANIVTVTQTPEGPNLAELEQCFQSQRAKLFYAVPDFHNPTGICWSLNTRQQVAELCQRFDVVLVEDVPYRELRFTGESHPLVSDFCPDQAIVLRSFSKIASPGLRLGAVSGRATDLAPMIKVKQGADLHSSVPMQALLHGLLAHPKFPEHLQQIRTLYRSRYEVLFDNLKKVLPNGYQLNSIDGGMFIWLTLPPCDTFALAQRLLAEGVAVVPSPVFYPDPDHAPAALRLNFTNSTEQELTKAVQRLVSVLTQA